MGRAHWGKECREADYSQTPGKTEGKGKVQRILKRYAYKGNENGDFEYCFTVPEGETFWYGFLLSLGSDVRVLEPMRLVERMLETCNMLIEEYEAKG